MGFPFASTVSFSPIFFHRPLRPSLIDAAPILSFGDSFPIRHGSPYPVLYANVELPGAPRKPNLLLDRSRLCFYQDVSFRNSVFSTEAVFHFLIPALCRSVGLSVYLCLCLSLSLCVVHYVLLLYPFFILISFFSLHLSVANSLTHSLTRSLVRSPTRPLTHSPTHSLTHSLTHLLIHSLTHSLTISHTHPHTHSLSLSLSLSLTHSLAPSVSVSASLSVCLSLSLSHSLSILHRIMSFGLSAFCLSFFHSSFPTVSVFLRFSHILSLSLTLPSLLSLRQKSTSNRDLRVGLDPPTHRPRGYSQLTPDYPDRSGQQPNDNGRPETRHLRVSRRIMG